MKNHEILRIIFMQFIFAISLFAEETVFFLPYDKNKALQNLNKEIDLAKDSIYITTYIFTNKNLAKKLKNASKKGIKIKIIYNEITNSSEYSQIGNLAKIKNIECRVFKSQNEYSKMHTNFIVIDNLTTIFGSLNFTKSALNYNYELLYIKKDFNFTKKFKNYFDKIYSNSEFY